MSNENEKQRTPITWDAKTHEDPMKPAPKKSNFPPQHPPDTAKPAGPREPNEGFPGPKTPIEAPKRPNDPDTIGPKEKEPPIATQDTPGATSPNKPGDPAAKNQVQKDRPFLAQGKWTLADSRRAHAEGDAVQKSKEKDLGHEHKGRRI